MTQTPVRPSHRTDIAVPAAGSVHTCDCFVTGNENHPEAPHITVVLVVPPGSATVVHLVESPTAGLSTAHIAPLPTQLVPTEPAPTEPAPTEPAPTEPAPTEPAPTAPGVCPVDEFSQRWAGLTTREQAIARLAAQGLTNRQISNRLYISPHTVNYHLRNIFQKLDIPSRTRLAGLLGPTLSATP